MFYYNRHLSSRVRENPGGTSSLANFWDSEEATDFKPTRRYILLSQSNWHYLHIKTRVRQGPGGHDSINDVRRYYTRMLQIKTDNN